MEKTRTQGFSKNLTPQELNIPRFDLTKWKNVEENKSDVWNGKILGTLKKTKKQTKKTWTKLFLEDTLADRENY